jgi:uncharacterized membrane protein
LRVSQDATEPGGRITADDRTPDARDDTPTADELPHLIGRLGRLLGSGRDAVRSFEGGLAPAWRRATRGESRLAVSIAIGAAIGMQLALPERVAPHPRWLLPGLSALLLVGIIVANPTRIDRYSRPLRTATLLLIVIISAGNAASAGRLVIDLVRGEGVKDPTALLLTGAAIWLTNVIVFALWYWEFDRGGPVARAHAKREHPDFMFPQMSSPELAPAEWEPAFVDYLYLSFTNATAFSPTDVMPLSRWAKLTMLVQSAVSLSTVALVIARAVNILK